MRKVMRTVIQEIASRLTALANCRKLKNEEWTKQHEEALLEIERDCLPHGSGFDRGCKITPEMGPHGKITITTSFHHMDENGYYDGWTDHAVIVTPDYSGFELNITGRDRNGWKEYAYDTFYHCLASSVPLRLCRSQVGARLVVE